MAQRVTGSQPKSVFQVGGGGAVGTGSLRGMPHLARLAEAGFSVWPFDDPGPRLVLEIYPRLLTGPVVKSDPAARPRYLNEHHPDLEAELRDLAVASVFDLAEGERQDLWRLVARVRGSLLERDGVDGCNVGINDGSVAGQTVDHAHVHVIPRRRGDVPDPRGGVRWVIPHRAVYWHD